MAAKGYPPLGTRVMWEYGRRDYAAFGEIGVVVGHADGGFDVQIDDEQPFYKACYGAKAHRLGHARLQRFTTDNVRPLEVVYRETADRFRRVAATWDDLATAAVAS